MSYIDTSVIVASLDPEDPRSNEARKILENEKGKIISELVLIELASVISRRKTLLKKLSDKLKLDEKKTLIALLLYILKKFKLNYKAIKNSHLKHPLINSMYRPVTVGIELSHEVKLKTLDLLHAAYVKALKEQGEKLEKLVTADTEFKKAEEQLRKIVKIHLHTVE